uniref:Deoxynucleotidyltransferase terminal-interacting protein 1 n=1 Tax=Macaca fascicularis TaxID=9541 RepID=A0A7N9DAW3_MACFA
TAGVAAPNTSLCSPTPAYRNQLPSSYPAVIHRPWPSGKRPLTEPPLNTHTPQSRGSPPERKPQRPPTTRPLSVTVPGEARRFGSHGNPAAPASRFRADEQRASVTSRRHFPAGGRVRRSCGGLGRHGSHWRRRAAAGTQRGRAGRLGAGGCGRSGAAGSHEPLEHNDKAPAGAAEGPPLTDDNKFFQKAALNVRDNVGEEVDTEQLIQEACRSCLEQAKLLFSDGEKVIPRLTHELPGIKRGRQAEEECAHRGSPLPKKRKGRPPGHILSSDRAAAGMVWKPKSCEPIRREGPKWDPARLNESTTFVLGSRANKALGMGGTRGRIYIKHPHLFKYAADPQDKHWLAEQHHMRATGGKMAYLLIEEDIRDLAASDDYRGCLDLKLEELKSFVLPSWMVEKMRKYMETLRTENEHRAVEAPPQT